MTTLVYIISLSHYDHSMTYVIVFYCIEGHLSQDALAASALSDLWTMATSVLLSGRILGVLIGGAVGAGNPKLAGKLKF